MKHGRRSGTMVNYKTTDRTILLLLCFFFFLLLFFKENIHIQPNPSFEMQKFLILPVAKQAYTKVLSKQLGHW